MAIGMWPATVSFISGPPPRYGTWVHDQPPCLPAWIIARWPRLPVPIEPMLMPLTVRASASMSFTLLYFDLLEATSAIGDVPISVTCARSFSVSNWMFGIRLGLVPCVSNTTPKV